MPWNWQAMQQAKIVNAFYYYAKDNYVNGQAEQLSDNQFSLITLPNLKSISLNELSVKNLNSGSGINQGAFFIMLKNPQTWYDDKIDQVYNGIQMINRKPEDFGGKDIRNQKLQSFDEWLKEFDPKIYNEALGWRKPLALAALGVGAGLAGLSMKGSTPPSVPNVPTQTWTAPANVANKYLPTSDIEDFTTLQPGETFAPESPPRKLTNWEQRVRNHDRKKAKEQRGGPKELEPKNITAPH